MIEYAPNFGSAGEVRFTHFSPALISWLQTRQRFGLPFKIPVPRSGLGLGAGLVLELVLVVITLTILLLGENCGDRGAMLESWLSPQSLAVLMSAFDDLG